MLPIHFHYRSYTLAHRMNLLLLRTTPYFSAYYDSHNDWLFIDWRGYLTLAAVQMACLELADVYQQRAYTRVLNSNAQVVGAHWDAAHWLSREFLPQLRLAGIEHLAWVCAPSARGYNMARSIARQLPQLPITLFDDVELAVVWLQRMRLAFEARYALLPRFSKLGQPASQPNQVLAGWLAAQW